MDPGDPASISLIAHQVPIATSESLRSNFAAILPARNLGEAIVAQEAAVKEHREQLGDTHESTRTSIALLEELRAVELCDPQFQLTYLNLANQWCNAVERGDVQIQRSVGADILKATKEKLIRGCILASLVEAQLGVIATDNGDFKESIDRCSAAFKELSRLLGVEHSYNLAILSRMGDASFYHNGDVKNQLRQRCGSITSAGVR